MRCMMEQQSHLRCKPHHFSPETLVNFSQVLLVFRTSEKKTRTRTKNHFCWPKIKCSTPPKKAFTASFNPSKVVFSGHKKERIVLSNHPWFSESNSLTLFPPQSLTVRPGKLPNPNRKPDLDSFPIIFFWGANGLKLQGCSYLASRCVLLHQLLVGFSSATGDSKAHCFSSYTPRMCIKRQGASKINAHKNWVMGNDQLCYGMVKDGNSKMVQAECEDSKRFKWMIIGLKS